MNLFFRCCTLYALTHTHTHVPLPLYTYPHPSITTLKEQAVKTVTLTVHNNYLE